MDDGSNSNDIVCKIEDGFEDAYPIKIDDLISGKYIENWNSNITFYYSKSDGMFLNDLLAHNISWFVISQNFMNLIKRLNLSNVQLLPIIVEDIEGSKQLEHYYVVNIAELSDAINWNHTKYKVFRAKDIEVKSIIKCAIDESKINNLDIIRLKEQRFAIYVSERFVKIVKKHKLTGMDFREISVIKQ